MNQKRKTCKRRKMNKTHMAIFATVCTTFVLTIALIVYAIYSIFFMHNYDIILKNPLLNLPQSFLNEECLTGDMYKPNKTFKAWHDRISFTPGLNTSIVADFLRPTNSYFLFTPSITLNITDFLKITFSSTSKNSVLYLYFHNEPGDLYSDWGGFPGNVFKDLVDSFRFDDNSIRERSGFKLKSLNFELEHDLHDWRLNMALKIEPRVITENNTKRYDFQPYFSIGIVWNPMDSMKTEIIDEYGEWEIR